MKAKPKGAKSRYRNLVARGSTIYYERVENGRRVRHTLETDDWTVAAERRDAWEALHGTARAPFIRREVPTLADVTARYLAEGTLHLAPTTRRDRALTLAADGPVLRTLGAKRLDEITPALLHEWYAAEAAAERPKRGRRSHKTLKGYTDALAAVLGYARDLELIEADPVATFRTALRRRSRTKAGRAERDPMRVIQPIETAGELDALVRAAAETAEAEVARALARAVDARRRGKDRQAALHEREAAAARARGAEVHVLVLLLLDAGLRLGEAFGLRWGSVAWGASEDDPARSLLIDSNRPRGGAPSPPKSGRARRVALSRRLRAALLDLSRSRFGAAADRLVLEHVEPANVRHREWRRVCERAGLGHRSLKCLRDTYASQLLSAGVQLGYISRQLGHSGVAVTSAHYARWAGGDEYRPPIALASGEVPADLLARLGGESPHIPLTSEASRWDGVATSRDSEEIVVELGGIEPPTLRLPA